MKMFVACSENGRIHYTVSPANDLDFLDGATLPGSLTLREVSLISGADPSLHGFDLLKGELYLLGEQPSEHHVFDYAVKQWVDPRTLQGFKDTQWQIIKEKRGAVEFSTFSWNNSAFNSDPLSQSRIQGAAQLATLAMINNQPFGIDWTLADNSVRTLNAQEMIAVGMAMGQHINACHTRARQLRSLIEAAQTKEEVEAIYWE